MSWTQWRGEIWPTTDDQAELRVHLWPPDSGYPRQSWRLELMHLYRPPEAEAAQDYSRDLWLSFDISDLFFHEPDWRRLSGHEIQATPAWHEAHEHFHRHHSMVESRITLGTEQIRRTLDEPRKTAEQERWFAHDFILRFGARDGFCFPCELDAWMIHEDDFLEEREDPATIAPFASTPPNLRVITRALFTGGSVDVPRSGSSDPVGAARVLLREGIGYDEELRETKIEWALHHTPDRKEIVPMPGWTSIVQFSTGVSIYKDEAAES